MNRKIAWTIGMMVAFGTMAAWASPGDCGLGKRDRMGHGKGIHRLLDKLDLTDSQKTEIDEIRKEMRAEAKPLREKMKTLKQRMHDLWQANTPNESAILQLQNEIFGIKRQLAELRVQMRIDLIDVLTPEQRVKMKEIRSQARGKRGKHGRRGNGCGDCPFQNDK